MSFCNNFQRNAMVVCDPKIGNTVTLKKIQPQDSQLGMHSLRLTGTWIKGKLHFQSLCSPRTLMRKKLYPSAGIQIFKNEEVLICWPVN